MDLNKHELINEYNNYYVISLINVMNGIIGGNTNISRLSDELIKVTNDTDRYFLSFYSELDANSELLLEKGDNNSLRSISKNPIPICLTKAEKIYLKAMLSSRYSEIFFSKDEKEALLSNLADISYIPIEEYCVDAAGTHRKLDDKTAGNIRILLKAIKENKEIVYTNKTREGTIKDAHGYPIKIEYSVMLELFQLSIWSSTENRPIKATIHRMTDIVMTDHKWNGKSSLKEIMEKRRCSEPLVLECTDINNTAERTMLEFSKYELEILPTENDKTRISVYYYDYDEAELLESIISFGPYIKVLSPKKMIDNVVNLLI